MRDIAALENLSPEITTVPEDIRPRALVPIERMLHWAGKTQQPADDTHVRSMLMTDLTSCRLSTKYARGCNEKEVLG